MTFVRSTKNPILTPGGTGWRKAAVFNPGAIERDGEIFLFERAARSLRPFQTSIGLLSSRDGVHFEPVLDHPILTGEMLGFPEGSVQDARVVVIDGRYLLTYALQPYGIDCCPTGVGLPEYITEPYAGWNSLPFPEITRSGIAVSDDLVEWRPVAFTTPAEIDDRDNVLFPARIDGRFALLRRPRAGTDVPSIWISYSDDLLDWSEPRLVAQPEHSWEAAKIGTGPPPIRTDRGWLLIYHGVDDQCVYRVGVMILDLDDVERVIARSERPVLEPQAYYERFGLVIPNVVFPCGAVVRDGRVFLYYGCADTSIALATARVDDLLDVASPIKPDVGELIRS